MPNRTHKAQVEQDFITGRKLINQYEIINEIGRGVHGKVKLARSLETGDFVAIKIIQRFSKKRKLGRVTVSPEDKTKREIAILKKIRHPNVVGLLEVIDDPELKKIYMVLEHVELGEIVWRRKGTPQICLYERRRIEKEQRGEKDTGDDEKFFKMMERRRQRKEFQRSKITQLQLAQGHADYWSLEHGDDVDEAELSTLSRQTTHESLENLSRSHRSLRSLPSSRNPSRTPSKAQSGPSSRAHTPLPTQMDIGPLDSDNEDDEPGPLPAIGSNHGSASALEGTYYGAYPDDPPYRGRSPSMADSIISHMSSVDDVPHDAFEDDFSYVPCFTIAQARNAFRDTVLGLEYLHYEGIVHRDIKPANLLWTRDHRVKISDFGVSYFGRPIREGETEENVSEADATDFDDDLELAKTVGTPAFFAPELCYTDEDIEPPKVTEQIDVWSLGITLYCLIFARLPFLADDEWQLFRCIAKEEIYIPKRRLKAVDPNCSKPTTGLSRRPNNDGPYREENELAYEDIGDELHDLLRRMLIKDPLERMKLREVKRHPWVIRKVDNVIGWLDDTDPSRKTAGRRIQVDRNELERAVVPITFLERARSTLKKVVGIVRGGPKSERGEGSRRRAISSATSSGTDTRQHTPMTPTIRDSRRNSLRVDEGYFASVSDLHDHHREANEHPLAQSQTASPDFSVTGDPFTLDFAQNFVSVGATPKHENMPSGTAVSDERPGPPDRTVSAAASIQTVLHRGHSHSRSVTTPTKERMYMLDEGPTTPIFTDHSGALFGGHLWSPRGRLLSEITEGVVPRARSVEQPVDHLFDLENKHAEPSVAVSTTTAPGLLQSPWLHHPRPVSRSAEASPNSIDYDRPLPSPLFFQPSMVTAHQQAQSASTPNVRNPELAASNLDNRPSTANRTPEGKTPVPRTYGSSTPESFQRAKETLERRRRMESEAEEKRQQVVAAARQMELPPCPPSPDDDVFIQRRTEQQEEAKRAQSYSSVNSGYINSQMTSQMTSPTDLTSPMSSANLGSKDQLEQFFPSVPSLPALISGASSVSADTEGDMLQGPGIVHDSTPESLTPPSLNKELSSDVETPIPNREGSEHSMFFKPDEDEEGYNGDGDTTCSVSAGREEEDDSDSDEGLIMTRRKPKKDEHTITPTSPVIKARRMERRGTNASVGSAETAKKVVVDSSPEIQS